MKRLTIALAALLLALLLAGCEAEDAGTARANSAAMQNQMDEMSGIISKLIAQNKQLQDDLTAEASGRNSAKWVLITLALVGGFAFAFWYVRYTHPHPAQPGGMYEQPHVLPQTQQPAGMLPEPHSWQLVQRGGREFMINLLTGDVREVHPVTLLEDGD